MIFKTAVTSLFTLSGLASALAATPAYYIAEFQATDREAIKPYSTHVESTFRPFGGRFIVRGGDLMLKKGLEHRADWLLLSLRVSNMPRTGITDSVPEDHPCPSPCR